ncbi:hypothetical protein HDU97_003626 [Phlyctochytrium planicorne]|nr:hypothetical protein HDU97_003626 [Phlyctochytrium planicorne]
MSLSGLGDSGANPASQGSPYSSGILYLQDPFQSRLLHRLRTGGGLKSDWDLGWEGALAFLKDGDPVGLFQDPPTKVSIYFNELFEYARLSHLHGSGFLVSKPLDNNLSKEDAKKLVDILSTSHTTIIEYVGSSTYIAVENLNILALYGAQLPLSWYTSDFVNGTFAFLSAAYRSFRDGHYKGEDCEEFLTKGFRSAIKLFSIWAKKSEKFTDLKIASAVVSIISDIFATEQITTEESAFDLLTYFCESFGKISDEADSVIVRNVVTLLQHNLYRFSRNNRENGVVSIARLMTSLPTSSLGLIPNAVSSALEITLKSNSHEQPKIQLEDMLRISFAWQYVGRLRWDMLEEAVNERDSRTKSWWKSIFGGQDKDARIVAFPTWLKAMMFEKVDGENVFLTLQALFAHLGLRQSVFERNATNSGAEKGAGNKKKLVFDTKLVDGFELDMMLQLERILNARAELTDPVVHDCIGFFVTQLLGSKTVKELWNYDIDYLPLLNTLLDTLFDSPDTLHIPEIYLNPNLEDIPELSRELSKTFRKETEHPLHRSVSQMSRLIGNISALLWKEGRGEYTVAAVQKLSGFAWALASSWEESRLHTGKIPEEFEKPLFQHFRLCLFAVTMILNLICSQIVKELPKETALAFQNNDIDMIGSGESLDGAPFPNLEALPVPIPAETSEIPQTFSSTMESAASIAIISLRALSMLHFVTVKFGGGGAGFRTWREVVESSMEIVFGLAGKEIDTGLVTRTVLGADDILEDLDPSLAKLAITTLGADVAVDGVVEAPSPVKTRLLMYFQMSSRLLQLLPERYVASSIIPKMQPCLLLPEPSLSLKSPASTADLDTIDLFEASHDLSLAVLERAGMFVNLTKAFAPEYVDLVLQHFLGRQFGKLNRVEVKSSRGIDFDLFRRGTTYAIKGLSSLSLPRRTVVSGSDDRDEEVGDEEDAANEFDSSDVVGNALSFESRFMIRRHRGRKKRDVFDKEEEEDGEEREDQLRENHPSVPQDELSKRDIGDQLAWVCVTKLVDAIQSVSAAIDESETKPLPPVVAEAQSGGNQSRLESILAAAPSVELYMKRDQLLTVLFDQIRTIGLGNLPKLLAVVRGLMLHGEASIGEVSPSGRDGEGEGLEMKGKKPKGLGVQTDPEDSNAWKSLFNAVGHSRGFDYLRRTGCTKWYLQLRADALEIWREYKKGNKVEVLVREGGNDEVKEPPRALMAKL